MMRTGVDYLTDYLPGATEAHRSIYSSWEKRFHGENNNKNLAAFALTYFYPYRFLLQSPFVLPEMEQAVALLQDFFHQHNDKKMVLYSDRDADGVTSSSILYLFFREKMGIPEKNLTALVPGEEDKYGITDEVAERIIAQKPDYLITLDCGSSNRDTLKNIAEALPGVRILVLDHHTLPEEQSQYPEVEAFVNPVVLPEDSPSRYLCTAGLAYQLIWALTYSFTSEYQKTYQVYHEKESCYVKNGLEVGSGADAEEFDLEKTWARETHENPELHRVARFLEKNPDARSIAERFFMLQTLRMKKVAHRIEPFLALSSIGAVADLMDLNHNNRILVAEGLRLLNRNKESLPVGLREILKSLDLARKPLSEKDLGFTLGPTINAPGRLGNAALALEALTVADPLEAAKRASSIKKTNTQRKALSQEAVDLIEAKIQDTPDEPLIIAYDERIHRGISGLVAGKLADKFGKPALVMVNDGDCLRGSFRAYDNENIFSLVTAMAPWFIQYGGHLQAAGFSLDYQKKDDFIAALKEKSKEFNFDDVSAQNDSLEEKTPFIQAKDIELTPALWKEMLSFAPYGPGNPHPVILIEPTAKVSATPMGKDGLHSRINFKAIQNPLIEGVWFFHGIEVNKLSQNVVQIKAEPQMNHFNGKIKYQLRIIGVNCGK